MAETLVLDTNAFNERGLVHALARRSARKILPAVAAAELFAHFKLAQRWPVGKFLEFLRSAGIEIEPLDAHKALAAVELAQGDFRDEGFDFLIAAHALSPGRILVTNDRGQQSRVPRAIAPSALIGKA